MRTEAKLFVVQGMRVPGAAGEVKGIKKNWSFTSAGLSYSATGKPEQRFFFAAPLEDELLEVVQAVVLVKALKLPWMRLSHRAGEGVLARQNCLDWALYAFSEAGHIDIEVKGRWGPGETFRVIWDGKRPNTHCL